jgi:hypothetical protein
VSQPGVEDETRDSYPAVLAGGGYDHPALFTYFWSKSARQDNSL